MPRRSLLQLYQQEFRGYSWATFYRDLLAGLTVAAVALPLALAFGVASGATAQAGLVTAIIGGIVIGALSGAPYQISGPTGAMSAVLVLLVQQHGLRGVWLAGFLSGLLLLLIGILRLGRFIAFIPAPVITGFTSGIAVIIAVGQLDNFLGVATPKAASAAGKLVGYFQVSWNPEWHVLAISALVFAIMAAWPKEVNQRFPGSLFGIVVGTAVSWLGGFQIPTIGTIPHTLILTERLDLGSLQWSQLGQYFAPAMTITALGAIESLLCGTVGSNMTGVRLQANQELKAQGIGNLIIPFFGGVPATAAIARTSVGIKAGGVTRLVSIIHAIVLLASMFVLAPVMSRIPLAALSAVLIVTAWRMNEWESIHYYFTKKFKTAIVTFAVTLVATCALDLTEAILIGCLISAGLFLSQIAQLSIEFRGLDSKDVLELGLEPEQFSHLRFAYLSGPLFFAAVGHFNEAFSNLNSVKEVILEMRGVPLIDPSGLLALERLERRLNRDGGKLFLAGVQSGVLPTLERGGLIDRIGRDAVFASSEDAIRGVCGSRALRR